MADIITRRVRQRCDGRLSWNIVGAQPSLTRRVTICSPAACCIDATMKQMSLTCVGYIDCDSPPTTSAADGGTIEFDDQGED